MWDGSGLPVEELCTLFSCSTTETHAVLDTRVLQRTPCDSTFSLSCRAATLRGRGLPSYGSETELVLKFVPVSISRVQHDPRLDAQKRSARNHRNGKRVSSLPAGGPSLTSKNIGALSARPHELTCPVSPTDGQSTLLLGALADAMESRGSAQQCTFSPNTAADGAPLTDSPGS